MIYSLDTRSYIKDMQNSREYDIWRARISDEEYSGIISALKDGIEAYGIITSSWIPSSDWSGTVYEPIYERVCRGNEDHAARFFSLLLWEVILNHEDVWSFGCYHKDGLQIKGMTYFRLPSPPNPCEKRII